MSKEQIVIREFCERLVESVLSYDFDTFFELLHIVYSMPSGVNLVASLLYMLPTDTRLQLAQYLIETHGEAKPPITTRQ